MYWNYIIFQKIFSFVRNALYQIKGQELDLTQKEYKQLIKDIKKALKYNEYEVDRPNYAVIKYSFIRDSVWVYYNEKAFSAVKLDLDYLNSKLWVKL